MTRTVFILAAILVTTANFSFAAEKKLPKVPPGFEVSLFAQEPLVRHPVSIAFDKRGRPFVAQGPQFRKPRPETEGDSILILIDENDDGVADSTKTFATGFNSVHGMCWKGRDLWVANAPDLTIVRDLDGDDVADEYVRVYTDLGNLEHGLHGLNWAPDGKLYMSKGNSKGLTLPGRIAPKPFRDLWGVRAPPGTPDFPRPESFRAKDYTKNYHHPADDWGREGGVLRCDDMGENLEIVCQGFRNPWDIGFDDEFNWLGTDNDQTIGDKIFMPFSGAHFGWGHPWSADWTGEGHLPTTPASGPFFEGSGTGLVFCDSPAFPKSHRGVFFIADWLQRRVYTFRRSWDGALMRDSRAELEVFAEDDGALFRPSDMAIGPDGALWILGWSDGYGAEYKDGKQTNAGRVFRITHSATPRIPRAKWDTAKRSKPYAEWTHAELIEDLGSHIPAWTVDAQAELMRRETNAELSPEGSSTAQRTWSVWTRGRKEGLPYAIQLALSKDKSLSERVQGARLIAHLSKGTRLSQAARIAVRQLLQNREARLRFEAVQCVMASRDVSLLADLENFLSKGYDRVSFFAAWRTLGMLLSTEELEQRLNSDATNLRLAALLALLHDKKVNRDKIANLRFSSDERISNLAALWQEKVEGLSRHFVSIEPERAEFAESILVTIKNHEKRGHIRYSLDGSPPNTRSPTYERPIRLQKDASLRAALFVDDRRVGSVREGEFHLLTREEIAAGSILVNARTQTGKSYRVAVDGLDLGKRAYSDRDYVFTEVPDELRGHSILQTANDDAGSSGDRFLEFETLEDITLRLGYDVRPDKLPKWIESAGFKRTQLEAATDDTKFVFFEKNFPAGKVHLGGLLNNERGVSNYIIAFELAPLRALGEPSELATTLDLLGSGQADRGSRLFHLKARCSRCHRIGTRGNNFAPDLTEIAGRSKPEEIAKSILEPSANIVEGFRTHVVVKKNGDVLNGVTLGESDISVDLVTVDGKRRSIPKKDIAQRKSAEVSAMPEFAALLSSQDVSDLVAYLSEKQKPADKTSQLKNKKGVWFHAIDGGLEAYSADQKLFTYEYADKTITRPFLSNVRARDGVQVTRSHPPGPDDPSDHAKLHPGIWLAFGDLSGEDYWRLRSRVRFGGFIGKPSESASSGDFAAKHEYLSPDEKRVICTEVIRLKIQLRSYGYLLIWESTFSSSNGSFYFGDQEEMGLGARVATPLREKARGRILSSEGKIGARATWGQAADWCDYAGRIQGKHAGITLLAAPNNPRKSWWHNRDYGAFVANMFGRKAMRQGPTSRLDVAAKEDFVIRYGIVIHSDASAAAYDPKSAWKDFLEIVSD